MTETNELEIKFGRTDEVQIFAEADVLEEIEKGEPYAFDPNAPDYHDCGSVEYDVKLTSVYIELFGCQIEIKQFLLPEQIKKIKKTISKHCINNLNHV